jgi:sigma-B regulation protein RsbU (phosphoserine phosphatase)
MLFKLIDYTEFRGRPMRNGKGLERKLTLILLAFAAVISAAIGGIGYKTYMDGTFAKYGHTAASVLKLALSVIDAGDMRACLASGKKSAVYEETQTALDRIKENMDVEYLYLFDVTADGSILYYIAAVNEYQKKFPGAEITSLGDKERFPDELTRQLLEIGDESPLTEIVNRTRYGYMLSVFSPVKDSKGGKIGLIGVDIDMNDIHAELTAYIETVALGAAVTAFSFAALLIFFVRRNVTGPIKVLAEKAGEFAAVDLNGNRLSAIKLHIRKKDEIGVLASAFEKMTEELVRYVSEFTAAVAVQERMESELRIARSIQAGVLPATFPAFPDRNEFDLYASMTPAKGVGGDFYDFFMMDESRIALVVADVSGKGVPAALFMMVVRTLIKNEARSGDAPNEVLERVNRTLCENNGEYMFVTAFICFYDIKTGLLNSANAGHNPPLIVKSGGEARELETPPGVVLALEQLARYAFRETALEPGDCILLYTDGVTEAFNGEGEIFTEARLAAAVNFPSSGEGRARAIIERVSGELRKFAGGAEQSDDITMLTLARQR